MSKITIYQKPTCSTCRKVLAIVRAKGFDVEDIDYFEKAITFKKLKNLIAHMGIDPESLLRKKEKRYKELADQNYFVDENSVVQAMIDYPELMQRPIVQYNEKVVLARPIEKIYDIL